MLHLLILLGSLLLPALSSAAEEVVFELSANGSRTTRPFTVQDRWEVQWTSDRSIGLFTVDDKGQPVAEIANASGPGKGSSYQAKGGTVSIQIISGGKWTITVVQLP